MYVVLDLKEKEKEILELKASILNMTLEQFVIASAKRYNGNENNSASKLICGHCKTEIELKPYAITINKEIGGKEYSINLRDFPSYKCSKCETSYSDSNIQEKTDVLLEEYLTDLICSGKSIPQKLSFNDLIQF